MGARIDGAGYVPGWCVTARRRVFRGRGFYDGHVSSRAGTAFRRSAGETQQRGASCPPARPLVATRLTECFLEGLRRNPLASGARISASFGAAHAARRPMASARKVRYAVIGAGNIAQVAVLPAFAHAKDNSELVAIVSGDHEKRAELAKTYELGLTGNYDELEQVFVRAYRCRLHRYARTTQHKQYRTAGGRARRSRFAREAAGHAA